MVSPRSPTSSNSSALFESDDTFLEALAGAVLPGDLIPLANNAEETVQNPPATSSADTAPSLEPPPCAQPAWNAYSSIRRDDEHDTQSVNSSSGAQAAQLHSHLGQDDELSLPQPESPALAQSTYKKRAYSVVSSDDERPALAQSPVHSPDGGTSSYLDSDTYGAARFGGFGEYMRRKRAKLQIQNAEMGGAPTAIALTNKLFSGLSIHVGQPALCY
jgi:DNA repair protein REV1